MRVVISVLAVVVAVAAGCATSPPAELIQARTALNRASFGPAAQLAPADLHKASLALDLAERAFADERNLSKAVDLAYIAERTAQSGAEINLATAQQQSASEQVVETMREVADVARQTAAGARQMADSAQMLTAIAERLHGIVYDAPQTTTPKSYFHEIDERMHSLTNHKEETVRHQT
jgi:hypothetical protein